jgi:hypothetical protein
MDILEQVQREVEFALQNPEKLFEPHCRFTFLVRNPKSDDGDMLLTSDDLRLVEEATHWLRKREEQDNAKDIRA